MAEGTQAVIDKAHPIWGTGRRKTAIARVRLLNGDGKLTLNGRTLEEYFPRVVDQRMVRAPLEATGAGKTYDIFITLKGGGLSGQSGAAKLGIARALAKADEALVPALRENDLLTRDGRMKERKKPGQKGARKKFQWTKR